MTNASVFILAYPSQKDWALAFSLVNRSDAIRDEPIRSFPVSRSEMPRSDAREVHVHTPTRGGPRVFFSESARIQISRPRVFFPESSRVMGPDVFFYSESSRILKVQ